MIILFEENETLFQNLGLGLLKDARSCMVKETLNDSFELELQYPITGSNFSKITLNRIIFCKSNPYSEAQPFRIYSISKPINGIIIVRAFHISYDMNGIVVAPINGSTPKLTLDQIQNKAIFSHNFKFYTDLVGTKTFKTSNYYNMRSLLMGSSESVLETYKGEILFDKFNVYVLAQRGSNKGASVRYAKNMKDVNHEVNYERLYNGVYPYYHQETTETTTETSTDGFKQVYIVGTKPFQDGWLSYTPDGEPYHPVDESPVQIMTEGDYYNKVYSWNVGTQRYTERIYNEMVNLIECVTGMIGMSDKPSWIYIDVTGLPNIIVKAAEAGYFKLATDSDWTKRIKGEIVFQGSITNASDGLLMYYSEVIPENTTSSEIETTSITHVELKDKIMWLDTDAAKSMKYNRILCLDLTSEFDETPDEEKLETKAKEYIEKNKIGQYKYDTRVSFIDLSSTTEGTIYEKMESIELGDTVNVVYENLGIDINLRVVSTTYNVLLNRYDSIDLGEKSEKISASSVQTGDNVSSLSNDVGYTDITTVNKLIAKTITADLIQAKNAKLSKAQIEELQTARIKCTGIIEATQFELDTLVAKMLTADNAVIKQTLEAGTVKVKGDITVTSGSIKIESTESGTVFNVDRDGNVTANSVHITGGELNINDTFTVTPDGVLTAQGADIRGRIEAESGLIAKFNIESDTIEGDTSNRIWSGSINTSNYVLVSPGYNAIITNLDSSNAHDWAFAAGSNFGVDNQGNLYAKNAIISGTIEAELGRIAGFEITSTNIHTINKDIGDAQSVYISSSGEYAIVSNLDSNYHHWSLLVDDNFGVTRDGELYAKSVDLTGKITATSGKIAGFEISDDTFKLIATNIEISPTQLSYGPNNNFVVLPNGTVTIQNGSDPTASGYESIVLNSNGITATAITVTNADISNATITLGTIGGFTIGQVDASHPGAIYKDIQTFDAEGSSSGVYLGPDGLRIGKNLKIFPDGRIMSGSRDYNESINYSIGDYCIHLGSLYRCISTTSGVWDSSKWEEVSMRSFGVDDTGKLTASSAEIIGNITAESGYIGKPGEGFTITSKAIYNGFETPTGESTTTGVYVGTDGIRLGQNVSATKVLIFDNLTANNSSTRSIYDEETDYRGSEFILSYDPKEYDRYISIREKETASAPDSTDDYIHVNDPKFVPIKAKTLTDETTFNISKTDYIYLNVDDSSLWEYNESTHQYDFIGTRDSRLRLYYDQISEVGTRMSIDFFDSESDWRSGINPHPRATQITVSADRTNIGFDLDSTNSPYFRLKITYGADNMTNCYIIQDNPTRVLLPAYSSSITITPIKYYNIKLKFITAKQTSSPEVGNIKLTLKTLPGFLVTPDGMMNAYNAKIWGHFEGDVNIESGSIRILGDYIDNTQIKYDLSIITPIYKQTTVSALNALAEEWINEITSPAEQYKLSYRGDIIYIVWLDESTHLGGNHPEWLHDVSSSNSGWFAIRFRTAYAEYMPVKPYCYYGWGVDDCCYDRINTAIRPWGSVTMVEDFYADPSPHGVWKWWHGNGEPTIATPISKLEELVSIVNPPDPEGETRPGDLTYNTEWYIPKINSMIPEYGWLPQLTLAQIKSLYQKVEGYTPDVTDATFEVTSKGILSANAGKIAKFKINDNILSTGAILEPNSLILSDGRLNTEYNIADEVSDEWSFIIHRHYGIKSNGDLHFKRGYINGNHLLSSWETANNTEKIFRKISFYSYNISTINQWVDLQTYTFTVFPRYYSIIGSSATTGNSKFKLEYSQNYDGTYSFIAKAYVDTAGVVTAIIIFGEEIKLDQYDD